VLSQYPRLSARDQIWRSYLLRQLPQSRRAEKRVRLRAEKLIELLELGAYRDKFVKELSTGLRRITDLACTLARQPRVLLLDEPSSGMGPEEAHQLGERLIDLRQAFGLTMLLIEHHVPLVTAVCDYVYVLNFGKLLAEGDPDTVRNHPEVIAAYLGGEAPEALEETEAPEDQEELLEASR